MRIMRTQITLEWMFITLSSYGIFGAEVTMTVCGLLADESAISFCPNDTYMICIDCSVRESFSLKWEFDMSESSVSITFSPGDEVGEEVKRPPITAILINRRNGGVQNDYKSQIQILSADLRDFLEQRGGMMNITCEAGASIRDSISVELSKFSISKIDDVQVNTNELLVSWTAKNSDVVSIVVVVKNKDYRIQISIAVEWNVRNASVPVLDSTIPYNVTVVVYDRCWGTQESEIFHVNQNIPSLPHPKSALSSTSEFTKGTSEVVKNCVPTARTLVETPRMQKECVNPNGREAAVIVLSIALVLAVFMAACFALILVFTLTKKKCSFKESSSPKSSPGGGFPHEGFELQESKEK